MMQSSVQRNDAKIYEPVNPIEKDDYPVSTARGSPPESTRQQTRVRRLRCRRCANLTVKIWLLEWLSWLLAAISISGIAIVLATFDGRPLPEWPYGITLGALVSVLATIATIGLAEPIAAGLGQAKWTWHTREQRMAEFDLIDEASRGPLKAAWLVCRAKGGIIAICGAILSIIVFGVNSFVQQVIRPSLAVAATSRTAVISIARDHRIDTSGGNFDDYDPELSMKAAFQRGLLDTSANASTFFVSPQCPTGNCTWQTYSSLGFCGRCADISRHLMSENVTTGVNTSLPNGVYLRYEPYIAKEGFIAMTVQVSNGMSVNQRITSIAYSDWVSNEEGHALADVFTIVAPYPQPNDPQNVQGPYASECLLQLCAQNFTSVSENGVFSEKSIGSPSYVNNTLDTTHDWVLSIAGTNYTFDWNARKGLSEYLADTFNSTILQSNSPSQREMWPQDGVAQSLFHWTNSSIDHLPSQLFDNIASSMTQEIRQVSNLTASGTSEFLQTIVVVRWRGMALSFAVLGLVAIYLLVVAVATSKEQSRAMEDEQFAYLDAWPSRR